MPKKNTNWTALEIEYVNGTMSLRELANKHSLNPSAVEKQCERYGWVEARRNLAKFVVETAKNNLTESKIEELTAFNAADLNFSKELKIKAAGMLESLDIAGNPAGLKIIAQSYDLAQKIGRLSMGLGMQSNELTGKDGKPLMPIDNTDVESISDEQLSEIIKSSSI